MNKTLYILGALLIAGFVVLGAIEMMKSQTPYITTASELRSSGDRPVQFMGSIVRESVSYSDATDTLVFDLKDETGATVPISYKGVKPANMDNADTAVVRGTYRSDTLHAEQVLLKCPSKYESK